MKMDGRQAGRQAGHKVQIYIFKTKKNGGNFCEIVFRLCFYFFVYLKPKAQTINLHFISGS
jgi:hypothetical protein